MRKEALQLVRIDDDGRCHAQKDALDVLRNLPKGKKIGVIGVAGLYRTGKSFLLNRLMGLQNGFDIGATVNACTKGIWMWGQPVEIGSDFLAILIDTEGLGSAQRTTNSDMKIFSLCILLSSLFIMNSMGAIDEMALESLNLVLNLSKNIQVKQNEKGGEDPRNLAQHFPAFHWVLRDFSLQPKNAQGKDVDAREYLENCLAHDMNGQESKNNIRSVVRDLFKQRDCTFLVRPVGDEQTLQNLSSVPYETLREPFRKQMDELTKQIYTSLKPKGMGNSSISGPMLAHLCEEYCDAINNSAIPSIHGAWQAVVQEQLRRVSKQAAAHYRKEMNEGALKRLPMADEALRAVHKAKKKEAMELFQSSFLEPVNERQIQSVKPYIANLWNHAQSENKDASQQCCAKIANEILEKAKQDLKRQEALMAEYVKNAVGPSNYETFSRTLVPKIMSIMRAAYEQQVTALEKKALLARSEVVEARSALTLQKDHHESLSDDQLRKMRGQLDSNETKWKLQVEELKDETQTSISRLERERDQLESQKRALAEQVKVLQEKSMPPRNVAQIRNDEPGCFTGLAESVSSALERLRSLEIEKSELKQRNEHEKQLIGLERKFNQKLTEARRESEAKVEGIRREYEKEIEHMREQNKSLQVKLAQQDANLKKTSIELENVRAMETNAMKQMQIFSLQRELAEAMIDTIKTGDPHGRDNIASVLEREEQCHGTMNFNGQFSRELSDRS
eukprot:GEMP01001774.1.p1 GENE.GEMP01001774.1~~GEMP01001774.1.p1  ORF type:complete len:733 (+),score=169.45 GEMP01001774.1:50-2248(+)